MPAEPLALRQVGELRRPVAIGLLMHLGVAFAWSAVFLVLYERFGGIRRVVRSPGGVLKVASVYGPIIWLVMSFLVIPSLVHRPPTLNYRWFIQLIGHIPFVALLIVYCISRGAGDAPARS